MATKSKSIKPFYAWLVFAVAISLLASSLFGLVSTLAWADSIADPFMAVVRNNNQDTTVFKRAVSSRMMDLLALTATTMNSEDAEHRNYLKSRLDNEGRNIIYYGYNAKTGQTVTNYNQNPWISGKLVLPNDYNYYASFDGQQFTVYQDNKPVDIRRQDSGYLDMLPSLNNMSPSFPNLVSCRMIIMVKDVLEENPYISTSETYDTIYTQTRYLSLLGLMIIGLSSLGLLLLIACALMWKRKREYDHKIAAWLNHIWVEAKLFITLMAALFLIVILGEYNFTQPNLPVLLFMLIMLLLECWWFYLLIIDVIINRRHFWSKNIFNALIHWYRGFESKYPWQQMMVKRAFGLVAIEAVLAFFSVLFLIGAATDNSAAALFLALFLAAVGIYLLYRYLHRYRTTIADLGLLVDQIAAITNGTQSQRLQLAPDADMYEAAGNLNAIQEGVSLAVAEQIKAERMKVELITNVSHDLKTPLTSIISYVDLLAKEEGLPPAARDYVAILEQKAERLQQLIQDLFDLAKASSDNITLELEKIDLVRLINQTLGDLEETISASGLSLRVNLPEQPVFIYSDGKKLYRVWENLISNALKYSLAGSRIFVELTVSGNLALATIKNTSNYEMSFTEEEVLQRFVRGDKARSSEGSGLGLSIAQSFTEICGGQMTVKIDGDLFKVELQFNTI